MLDLALIDLLAKKLEAASAAAGWNYVVVQANGPTQQGISTDPMIMFQKLFDDPYGWPKDVKTYDATNDIFVTKSIQEYRTTFQISAFVIQVPDDLSIPTASDVVNQLYNVIHSRKTVSDWMKQGVNIERSRQVGNPYFEDDRDRFEARPSFDIVLTHSREVADTTPAVHVVEGSLERI